MDPDPEEDQELAFSSNMVAAALDAGHISGYSDRIPWSSCKHVRSPFAVGSNLTRQIMYPLPTYHVSGGIPRGSFLIYIFSLGGKFINKTFGWPQKVKRNLRTIETTLSRLHWMEETKYQG